ncbi:branched-chain amino acid ABC transporter permease [Phaeobacter sp. 11ANDIMAR09]|uniref:branched-chain amino acid ABC transporter permease n=1 Tax=Phaeobacter sp. 11ANDIMAR09 TaxID=1225647 RepID=UPI0006C8BAA1|nr:branched-chain amino acid ABC transporter permease [Phaeobacter sp. 11ANDIMAR09]KPD10448.1 urea ABC transporter [Phaeobacter sp. 11ANDIMAR09]
MDLIVVILVEMLYAVASLILISAGLAVVFGMMKVINLAHGEFMMLGGYATITAVNLGVNIFLAMLIIAPIVVGLIGLITERLVIRHLYGRLVDTMLATWGLSLFFIGLATMIFGNTTTGISTPIPGFTIGNYQINGYNFFIIVVAGLLLIGMLTILKSTRAGLIARGAMQRSDMAAALGYSPDRIYMATFFCGSALSGLAGAVLAPLVGLVPTSGGAYIAKSFITVIAGGPSLIAGLFTSAGFFGIVNQVFTFAISPVIGEVALLVAAVVLLRLLPQGITAKFFKGKL